MKAITGGALVKRLITLRGKFFYANERSGDHRLHAALNAFEHEAMTLRGAEVAFACMGEADHAGALWDECHGLALRAFYRIGMSRRVFGLGVEPPPPAPPQFGAPSPFPIAHA
ncbi:hypothetical protein ABLE93_09770 [Xanthobacter sp. KR7-65]|uniref:hypothetical protein n=1 Tax=Xanthobacter sp. KR7-65 TaxID=3156612 RepID=UPI0032B55A1E